MRRNGLAPLPSRALSWLAVPARADRAIALTREWWGLPAVVLLGLVAATVYVTSPVVPRPIYDDSYISLTFARNLAEHYKLSFDGIDWSTGATSPLHVTLLALALKLGFDPINTSLVFGILSHGLLAASVYLLGWAVFRSHLAALLGGVVIAFTSEVSLDAGNGQETGLFMSLIALSFASFLLWPGDRGRALTGLLIGLAVLTRPEGVLLLPAVVIYRWLERPRDEPLRRFLREATLLAAPGMAFIGLQALYSVVITGGLNSTATAKLHFFQDYSLPFREKIRLASDLIGDFAAPVLALIALAAIEVRRREALLFGLVWVPMLVLYALFFASGLGHYFYRYQHPVLPLLAVLAGGGAVTLVRVALANGYAVKLLVAAALVVAVVPFAQQYENWRLLYKEASAENYADMEAMAIELNGIIKPNEVLATHDIGVVGYYADYFVLDLVGLVNPEVVKYNKDRRLPEYIEGVYPDYLLIFPSWDRLHVFAHDQPERYELVREFPGGRLRGESFLLYRVIER